MATIKKRIKKAAPKKVAPKKATAKPVKQAARELEVMEQRIVTVHVKFDNANAGVSDCTVTHNSENPQLLNQSGSASYNDVVRGDTLEVDGMSPGKTTITVSGANTQPVQMVFAPGQQISGFFRILE